MVSEPVFITTSDFGPYSRANGEVFDHGGQYITFYYVGQIPADAVRPKTCIYSILSFLSLPLPPLPPHHRYAFLTGQ